MRQTKQLGEESITRLLIKFSIPATVGMLVNALYNVVDRIFVGNGVGKLGLAAITVEFPLTMVVMAFIMLIGIGASTLISIRLGQKKDEEAQHILGNAFVMLIIVGTAVTIAGLVFLGPLLSVLGASEDVMPYAKGYGGIIIAGSIFFTIGMGLNNIIRAEGNPRIAMATMLIGAIINIILDPIFIYGFGWGIQGAAIATIIAKAISAVWVLHYFLSGRGHLKLALSKIRMNGKYLLGIITLGLSPFAMHMASSLLNFILNNSLTTYGGDLALSGMGIVGSIASLMLMPIFGINQGLQPIIGYNYGAGNFHRVKEALLKGMAVATVFTVIGSITINLFSTQLVSMFNKEDTELIALSARALKVFLMALPIIGAQIVGANYFQAVGKPKHAAFLSLSRQVLILIPAIIILPRFFQLDGIFYAGPLADILSALLTTFWVIREVHKLNASGIPDLPVSQENSNA